MSLHRFRDGLYISICQSKLDFPQQNVKDLPDFMNWDCESIYWDLNLAYTDVLFICLNLGTKRTWRYQVNWIIWRDQTILFRRTYQWFVQQPSKNRCGEDSTNIFYSPLPKTSLGQSSQKIDLFSKENDDFFQKKLSLEWKVQKELFWKKKKKGTEDMFGWVEMEDNSTWYNSVTGEKRDDSPYQ